MSARPVFKRDLVLAALMLGVALLCAWWRLSAPQEDSRRGATPLEALVPSQFGVWRLDPVTMGLVRPAVEAAKAYEMYDQILERVYLNDLGERVMVSVAYGRRQSVGLQMHRPEVCYRSGGFAVSAVGSGMLTLHNGVLPVTRLVAQVPGRHEPITYWQLLGDRQVSDDQDFRWSQLQLGLARRIPDGLLFRVSSLDTVPARGWALQARFIRELDAALTLDQRRRLLGMSQGGASLP
jgi:EpsI family protein